jgi:hypothetical protein
VGGCDACSGPACGAPDAAPPSDADRPDIEDAVVEQDAELEDAGFAEDAAPDDAQQVATMRVETTNDALIESSPPAIRCGGGWTACEASFAIGSQVRLNATDTREIALVGWGDDCGGTSPSVTVDLVGDSFCAADFVRLEGRVVLDKAPHSVLSGESEDGSAMHIFRETANKVHLSTLPVDQIAPGPRLEAEGQTLTPQDIALDSYFIHLDPPQPGGTYTASIAFPREIVALVSRSSSIDATDGPAGASPSFYPAPGSIMGREVDEGSDTAEINADRHILNLNLHSVGGIDQLRVLIPARGHPFPIVHSRTIERLTSPPASVRSATLESDNVARLFREREATLTEPLAVDIATPGTYTLAQPPAGGTIPASTQTASWFMHVDPITEITLVATIVFDRPILGIVAQPPGLDVTDAIYGAAGTTYPTGNANRAAEAEVSTSFTLHEDRRSVSFTMRSGGGIDQVRFILAR